VHPAHKDFGVCGLQPDDELCLASALFHGESFAGGGIACGCFTIEAELSNREPDVRNERCK
jgi:hypothetical protein